MLTKKCAAFILLWVVWLVFSILNLPTLAQEPVPQFEHLTIDRGLSDNTVYSIAQDHSGFLWFGTQDGLNRFDGYNVTIFRHDPSNPNSVSNNNAGNIYLDSQGMLWIGTWGGGVDRYNPQTGQFTNFSPDPNNSNSLSDDRVQTIFEDKAGNIWLGTAGGGLNKYNPQTETFTLYKNDPNTPSSISNDRIWKIDQDNDGYLWIATSDGLNKFNPQTETFTRYYHDPQNPRSLSHSLVRTLYLDKSGTLWVGTEEGLNRYIPQTDDFDVFLNDPNDPASLNDNIINAIFEDSQGNFWIGLRSQGIDKLNRQTGQFTHYQNNPQDFNSLSYNDIRFIFEDRGGVLWFATRGGGVNKFLPLSDKVTLFANNSIQANTLNNNDVRAVYEDTSGNIWIGTKGGGLNKYNPQSKTFTAYQADDSDPNSLSSNDIYAIYQDDDGILWLGTSGGGLNKFNPQTGQVTRYLNDPNNPNSLSSNDIYAIYQDDDGILWLGAYGGGLNKFNPETGQVSIYQEDSNGPASLSNDDVYAIYQIPTGELLIGTYGGGLNIFNPDTEEIIAVYQNDPQDPNSLSNDNIYNIFADQSGQIWLTTANGGLNKFDIASGQFTRYTQQDGLPSNVTYGILSDDEGNLWLSSNKGLSKFNPNSNSFVNYDASDGLENIIYQQNSFFRGQDGTLFFGGINGLLEFDPKNLPTNSSVPPVALTGFQLFNQPLDFGQPVNTVDTIELSYQDNVISFEFAALDYTNPAKNRYAYMLEGFDNGWVESGSRNFATYTNLDPGEYTFRVKGANNAGVWNEEGASVKLVITPPFWETWWFRVLALLGAFGLVFAIYRSRVSSIEKQRNQLEQEVAQRTLDLWVANEQLQILNDTLQNELAVAQRIQQSLLPPPRPNWPELDIICYSMPVQEVGGDFYTYHRLNNGHTALVVGDISGKGLPAALLMAVSVGSLKSIIDQGAPAPKDVLSRLNQTLLPYNASTNQNCALCYADLNNNTLHVANAGGITPALRRANGDTEWLDVAGLPLGVELSANSAYKDVVVPVAPGDMVIFTSDGVVEATSISGQFFGFRRLREAIAAGPANNASAMLNHLQNEIAAFLGEAEAEDDITIMVLKI